MYQKIDFSNKPVIEGTKVVLRPFAKNDWEEMIKILDDLELKRLTGSVTSDEEANATDSPEEVERIKQWYLNRNEQNDRLDLAIVDIETGLVVGEAVFNEYEEETGNVNFRILIGRAGRNKGLGSEAVSLFIRYGMTELQLHKIGMEVYSFNPRAERVYQKAGFVLEGVKREDFIYNGEYIDTKIYGMLRADHLAAGQ
jgi:RimJ/RimL family protein N-acetyltransferase